MILENCKFKESQIRGFLNLFTNANIKYYMRCIFSVSLNFEISTRKNEYRAQTHKSSLNFVEESRMFGIVEPTFIESEFSITRSIILKKSVCTTVIVDQRWN